MTYYHRRVARLLSVTRSKVVKHVGIKIDRECFFKAVLYSGLVCDSAVCVADKETAFRNELLLKAGPR